ncbi:MAG: tetratricopeptide repeat protein [Myxococcota bacterium]|nr:tetratricopeptide repeat protein [Myxococcota bacterium]
MTEPREDRWLSGLVLGLVALAYGPSLAGGWVWDDVYQLRDNPAITRPLVLASSDVWGPTGFANERNTPVYRPLAMLSHVPGQLLWRSPLPERVLSLALHLGVAAGVAALGAALGLGLRARWFGAACVGLHPAATEAVAWISARADVLGTLLVMGGALALARGRPLTAGGLTALAPFCKEPFVLAPAFLAIWMVGLRRRDARALALSMVGVSASFAARSAFGIGSPGAGPLTGPGAAIESVGATALRGVILATDPLAPDALSPYAGSLVAGLVALVLALPAFAFLPGRPWLAALLAPLPLLAPAAPASLANGFVGDRYFYVALAGLGVALAIGFALLESRRSWAPLLFVLPLCWAPFTGLRAWEWRGNEPLFRAAVARHPDGAEALFHLGHALQVERGDCAGAMPLYVRAAGDSTRAANNYQACLLDLGRFADAARVGPGLARRDPENPTPALNTARALSLLGDQVRAEEWAREGLRRDGERASSHVLLGNVLGLQERYAEARDAFVRALAQSPGHAQAARGLALAQRRLAASGPAPPTPSGPGSEQHVTRTGAAPVD